jgi:predicted nucleotidyltransferase
MNRAQIIQRLSEHKGEFAAFGVRSLSLFGSVARGEERPGSDIDILVEFERVGGLFEFVRLKNYLEKTLGQPVDLVTPDALKPQLREKILCCAAGSDRKRR